VGTWRRALQTAASNTPDAAFAMGVVSTPYLNYPVLFSCGLFVHRDVVAKSLPQASAMAHVLKPWPLLRSTWHDLQSFTST